MGAEREGLDNHGADDYGSGNHIPGYEQGFHGGGYGGGHRYGRGGYVRSKPVHLRTVAALSAMQWMGKRAAIRITPLFLILTFLLGVPLAYLGDPEVIGVIGGCIACVVWVTQRNVSADRMIARQWALRVTALPVAGTGWVLLWWWMHTEGMQIISKRMILAYLAFGTGSWAWLYSARFISRRRTTERDRAAFAPVAARIGLAGARVARSAPTRLGHKLILDIRGTGKTPGEVATSTAGELLAGHAGLPPGRVRVTPSERHAGMVEISTWSSNPWKAPIAHPGAPIFPDKRVPFRGDFPVGIDPETGDDITMAIVNEDGGLHWTIAGGTRGGKTNLLNVVVERLTRMTDAGNRPLVRITMIDIKKGLKDAANWGPAVHAVHAGPAGLPGALAALQRATNLIAERADANGRRARSKHHVTATEPIDITIIDEASFLFDRTTPDGRRAAELTAQIARGGASEMVLLIVASQRGVLTDLGTTDLKANAFGTVILPVRKRSEQTLVISDWRERGMPDMATYGQGAKGVVLIIQEEQWEAGRVYELHDIGTVRRIAMQRVLSEKRSLLSEPAEPAMPNGTENGKADGTHPWVSLGKPEPEEPEEPEEEIEEEEIGEEIAIPDEPEEEDLKGRMDTALGRMTGVTQWAAEKEQSRSPQERAVLARAWREHTWQLDQGEAVPAGVNRYIRTLAEIRGADGFTRGDVLSGLEAEGGTTSNRTSVARWLRILTSQGHLERLPRQGPQRADLYRLGARHRNQQVDHGRELP